MKLSTFCNLLFAGIIFFNALLVSQTVQVGAGSYSTTLPSGGVGPQNSSGASVVPKVSATFQKPAQTNDYWSSLIYPFYGDAFSNCIYAHPMNYKLKLTDCRLVTQLLPSMLPRIIFFRLLSN